MKIAVVIKPQSKHPAGLVEQPDGSYVLSTKEPPIEGRANAAAVAIIAKYFGVPKAAVRLTHGTTSRHKIFEISL